MKKSKRIISLLLSLVMLLSITAGFGIITFADEDEDVYEPPIYYTSGDYEYMLRDDGTALITNYNGSAAELVVPSEIDGNKIYGISWYVFSYNENLKNVTISDGIEVIGKASFLGCKNLTSITIPNSVNAIEFYAFRNCTSLTDIIIPDGVSELYEEIFGYCTALEHITLGSGLKEIFSRTFNGCTSLKSITIPNNVTTIMGFDNCPNLKDVIVLNPAAEMEYSGFAHLINYGTGYEEMFDGVKIYGYKGSTAENYAEENGCEFIEIADNPIISDGTDTEYTIGSESGASIHCIYPLGEFVSVSVNGNIVDESNYTLEEGSTILNFKPSYLNTLKAGEYTVALNYTMGTVETALTIVNNATTPSETPTDKPSEPATEVPTETPTKPTVETPTEPTTEKAENTPTATTTAPSAEKTTSNVNSSEKSPSTGYDYLAALTFMIAVVSGIGSVVCFVSSRKKCEE